MTACKLAKQEVTKRHSGITLVCLPTEDQAVIGNEKTRRTRLRVFPIKVKYVV